MDQRRLTPHLNCSMRPTSGKLSGIEVHGTAGYHQSLLGCTFIPASGNVEFELHNILADQDALKNEVAIGLIKNHMIPSPTTNPLPTSSDVFLLSNLIFIATRRCGTLAFSKSLIAS
jgi:myosin-5